MVAALSLGLGLFVGCYRSLALLLLRFPILGMGVTARLIAFLFVAVAKEALALGRFARLDRLQSRAVATLEAQDLDMVQTA